VQSLTAGQTSAVSWATAEAAPEASRLPPARQIGARLLVPKAQMCPAAAPASASTFCLLEQENE